MFYLPWSRAVCRFFMCPNNSRSIYFPQKLSLYNPSLSVCWVLSNIYRDMKSGIFRHRNLKRLKKTKIQRMENQFTNSTTSSMDSESCSSESLTDIKSIVYDSDLLSMDIQQVGFFYDFGTFRHEVFLAFLNLFKYSWNFT